MKAARGLEIIRTRLRGVDILMGEADNKKRKQIKGVISEFNIATRDRKEGEVIGCGSHGVYGAVTQGPKLGNSYSAIILLKFLIILPLTWYFVSDIWWVHGVCLGLSLTPKSFGVSPGLVHFCGSNPFLFVVIDWDLSLQMDCEVLEGRARSACSGLLGTRPRPGSRRLSVMKSWARREIAGSARRRWWGLS